MVAATACAAILDAPAVRQSATRPHMRLLQVAVAKSASSRASASAGIRATHNPGESARLPSSPPPHTASATIAADASATVVPAATQPVAPRADNVALRTRPPTNSGADGWLPGPSGDNAPSQSLKALFATPDGLLHAASSDLRKSKLTVSAVDSGARVSPGTANSQSRGAAAGRRTGSRSRSPVREVQRGPGRQREGIAAFDPSARVPARAAGGGSSHSGSASLISRSTTERMSGASSGGIAAPVTSAAQVTSRATPGPPLQRRRSLLSAAVSGIRADRAQLSASSAASALAMGPRS